MKPSMDKIYKTQKIIDQMAHQFIHYVRPVIFGDLPLKSQAPNLNNATITFIETKSKKFGITNSHVIDAYHNSMNNRPDVTFQISDLKFDILNRIIDKNKKLDLVTIDINESEIKYLNISPLFHINWPVLKIKTDEVVFMIGYPGEFRFLITPDRIDMHFVSLLMLVASISEDKFGIIFDKEYLIVDNKTHDPSELTNWGGFSGAGVFRVNGLIPELVGLIFEHQPIFDILYCSHSYFINPNGTINDQ